MGFSTGKSSELFAEGKKLLSLQLNEVMGTYP